MFFLMFIINMQTTTMATVEVRLCVFMPSSNKSKNTAKHIMSHIVTKTYHLSLEGGKLALSKCESYFSIYSL